jgi:copper(I)-binding protein
MTALNARFFQDVRTVFLAVILALWAGMAGAETSAARTLRDAWIRPPLAEGRPAALYFVLDNPGAATAITAVATPAAGRTELHTHAMAHHGDHGNHGDHGGHAVMQMRQVAELPVPAGGQAVLQPHGDHVMLFDVNKDTLATGLVDFTVTLSDGSTLTAAAEVKK